MSRINLENLVAQRPDLEVALRFLDEWLSAHRDVQFVPLARLAVAEASVPPVELIKALQFLCEVGVARLAYRVAEPDGTLLSPDYTSLKDVPARVPDRFRDSYIDTADTDVVEGYRISPEAVRG